MPYFKDQYRPVKKGDTFLVRGGFKAIEFKVLSVKPGDSVIVDFKTEIVSKGKPVKRKDEDKKLNDIGYDDIGGCKT